MAGVLEVAKPPNLSKSRENPVGTDGSSGISPMPITRAIGLAILFVVLLVFMPGVFRELAQTLIKFFQVAQAVLDFVQATVSHFEVRF